MKRAILALGMLLCVPVIAGTAMSAANTQPSLLGSPPQTRQSVPYGPGGKITARPPGQQQYGGGPVDSHAVFVPLTSLGLPVFGSDLNVSAGGANELTIASNPINPLNFVAGANASGTGHYTTTDGGQTWLRGSFNGIGDPTVTFDASGNAYFAELSTYSCPDPVRVYKSTNGGVTWLPPVVALTDPSPTDHFVDKEWITADTWPASPYYGRIYVAATSFYAPACNLGAYINNREVLAYSSDGGATWSPSITVSDPTHDQNQFVNPVVAPNGTVFMGYQYQNCTYNCHGIPASNMLTRSTDGGVSWSFPITITGQPISYTGASISGYQTLYASSASTGFRHNNQAIVAISPTDPNVIYVLWSDGRWDTTFVYQGVTGWHSDIAFSRSTDGGATWTAPARVNDDPQGNGKDQFFPWMAVGTDGTLHASWMDRRDSATGFQYREYYSQSTDGGLTWSPNQPVGDVGSTPNNFIGDYTGIAVNSDNTLVLPIWTDMRSGQQAYTDRGMIGKGGTPTGTVTLTVTPTPTSPTPPPPTTTRTPSITATATSTCIPGWYVVDSHNPGANRNELHSVSALSADDIWAVGSYNNGPNTTLVQRWTGNQWNIVPSPNGTFNGTLLAVDAVSTNDVWAVGYHGPADGEQTLIEHWDGSQWSVVPSPNATGGNYLFDVAAVSADDIWAVGMRYIYPTQPDQTLIEHWNGSAWSIVPSPNASNYDMLYAVEAVSANDVWAVGMNSTGSQTLIEHWNGTQWSLVPGSIPGVLLGISATGPNDIWAVGYQGPSNAHQTLAMHWDGSQWGIVPSPNPAASNELHEVIALSANDVWAVGRALRETLVEHWDGARWSVVPSPSLGTSNNYLESVVAVSANDVWAVGYYWDNGGARTQTLIERYTGQCVTPSASPTPTATPTRTPTATRTPTVCPGGVYYTVATATGTIMPNPSKQPIGCNKPPCLPRVNLPFPFRFYDQTYTAVNVSPEGNLQFVTESKYFINICPLPAAALGPAILPHWDDLRIDPGSGCPVLGCGMFTIVTGSAPNRVFSIEWRARFFAGTGGVRFEVRLHENSPNFEVVYGQVDHQGVSASVGVQDGSTRFTTYSCNQDIITNGLMLRFTARQCEPTGTPTRTPTLTRTPSVTPCAMTFSDVQPTDYFYAAVRYLYCMGVVSGYGDNTFRPYNNTTRAQLCKIVVLAEGWPINTAGGPHFSDVPREHSFYDFVETAYNHQIISGYGDNTFRPNNDITRGQLCKIIVLAERWPYQGHGPHFCDVPENHPFYDYIEVAYNRGVISGYNNGCGTGALEFRPGNPATRGQICKIVYLALTGR